MRKVGGPPETSDAVPKKSATLALRNEVTRLDEPSGLFRIVREPFDGPSLPHVGPELDMREARPKPWIASLDRREMPQRLVHADGILQVLEVAVLGLVQV